MDVTVLKRFLTLVVFLSDRFGKLISSTFSSLNFKPSQWGFATSIKHYSVGTLGTNTSISKLSLLYYFLSISQKRFY